MNAGPDVERLITSWLVEEAPVRAPDRILHAAGVVIDRTNQRRFVGALRRIQMPPQERDLRDPRRSRTMPFLSRLAAAAVLAALVVGGAVLVGRTVWPPIADTPSPSATALESPSPSESSTPPPFGLVAYIVPAIPGDGFTRDELWLAGADGTGAHSLLPGFGRHHAQPVWSPDGRRLVFVDQPAATASSTVLFWTDASGATPVAVDTGCPACATGDAAFSPNGSKLAFVRDVIVVLDLETGSLTSIQGTADDVTGGPVAPRWSPDGTQFAFTRALFGGVGGKDIVRMAVFVMNVDGTGLHQVTPDTLPAGQAPWGCCAGNWSTGVDWSPDGSRLVFSSQDDVPGHLTLGTHDLWTIGVDGSELTRLTTDGVSTGATWSLDGRIQFIRDPEGADLEYWVMNADGSDATRLSTPVFLDGVIDVAWGPAE